MILSCKDIEKLGGTITLDVETTGGRLPHQGRLVGLGVWATDAGVIGYVPCTSKLDHVRIRQAVKTWQVGSFLIGHNLSYEAWWLGMDYAYLDRFKLYDSLVAEHLLAEELSKDLGSLEVRYLGSHTKKELLAEGDKYGGIKTVDKWPVEVQAEYCINDCRVTLEASKIQMPRLRQQKLTDLFKSQMEYLKRLLQIEQRGIVLDRKACFDMLSRTADIISQGDTKLREDLEQLGLSIKNYNSPQQLSKLLYQDLELPKAVMPPNLAHSPRAKKFTQTQTGAEFLTALRNPIADRILQLKALHKQRSFIAGWLEVERPFYGRDERNMLEEVEPVEGWQGKHRYGSIHASYNQTGTVTARLSCSKPNMQQVSTDPVGVEIDGIGLRLRPLFVAPKGYKLISIDYKQMEVVVFAILSQEPKMMAMIHTGEDMHKQVSKLMYGTEARRADVKSINFGILYGLGDEALAMSLGIALQEARALREEYLNTFRQVRPWMRKVGLELQQNGFITYWSGRRRRIPEANLAYRGVNSLVQGGCADVLAMATCRVAALLDGLNAGGLVGSIHDELLYEVKEDMLDEVLPQIIQVMGVEDIFGIKLNVDAEVLDRWGEND